MTFKYIKIFAVNHLRAFMSESEHVMNINVALQCCINDYLLWLVTFQKSCMFQNIRSTNIARYDWIGSQATFHEWMLYPSVGVVITSSGVLLIWKPRSCSPWQSINFENAKHRTTRHKKAECDVHYSKFSFFFRCHVGLERELWPRRSFSGKPLCVIGGGASWGNARDSGGGGGGPGGRKGGEGPSWGLQSATEIPAAAAGDCHGHGGNHLANKVSPARYVAHRRKERTSSKSKIVISFWGTFLFQSENSLKFFTIDISHLLQVVWQIQGVLTEGHWLKEVNEIDQLAPVELFSPVLCWNEVD